MAYDNSSSGGVFEAVRDFCHKYNIPTSSGTQAAEVFKELLRYHLTCRTPNMLAIVAAALLPYVPDVAPGQTADVSELPTTPCKCWVSVRCDHLRSLTLEAMVHPPYQHPVLWAYLL